MHFGIKWYIFGKNVLVNTSLITKISKHSTFDNGSKTVKKYFTLYDLVHIKTYIIKPAHTLGEVINMSNLVSESADLYVIFNMSGSLFESVLLNLITSM